MYCVVSPPLPEEHRCGKINGSIYKVHVSIQSTDGKPVFGVTTTCKDQGTSTVYTTHVAVLWFQTGLDR